MGRLLRLQTAVGFLISHLASRTSEACCAGPAKRHVALPSHRTTTSSPEWRKLCETFLYRFDLVLITLVRIVLIVVHCLVASERFRSIGRLHSLCFVVGS